MHQVVYGGWTVYAAGDHFVGGELTVAGTDPNYAGRAQRLLGLLVDRDFGLVAWAPVFLLTIPAVAALAAPPPAGRGVGAGAVRRGLADGHVRRAHHARLVVAGPPDRRRRCPVSCWPSAGSPARCVGSALAVVVLGALGALTWAWVAVQVLRLDLRLVIDFADTTAPLHRALRPLLPDMAHPAAGDWALFGAWAVAAAALLLVGWHSSRTPTNQEEPHVPIPSLGRSR